MKKYLKIMPTDRPYLEISSPLKQVLFFFVALSLNFSNLNKIYKLYVVSIFHP